MHERWSVRATEKGGGRAYVSLTITNHKARMGWQREEREWEGCGEGEVQDRSRWE